MSDMIKYLRLLISDARYNREVSNMGYGCCGMNAPRSFLTREEKVEMLKEYASDLETEVRGVKERIAELEKNA